MELNELIGLHLIKRIDVIRNDSGSIASVSFTMAGTRYRAVWQDVGRGESQLSLQYAGVDSFADGDGFPVFCIYWDTYGESGLASDILEIYDTKTAKPILILGTEEIEVFPECRLSYYPENIHCIHKERLLK